MPTHTRKAKAMPTNKKRKAKSMPTPMPTPTPTRNALPMPMPTPTRKATHLATATSTRKPKVNLLGLLPYGVLDNAVDILDTRQLNMLNLLTRNSLLSVPNKRPVKNPLVFADVKITNNDIDTMCKIANTKELHTLILDNVKFDKKVIIKTLFNDVVQLEKLVIKNMRFDANLITFLSNIESINLFELHTIINLKPEDISEDDINIRDFQRTKRIQHTTRLEFRSATEYGSLRGLRDLPKSSSSSSSR
jgi:hypothetical protein